MCSSVFKVDCLLTCCPTALPVPQQLSISPNLAAQQLSISWVGGAATAFDLTILRTELDETVYFVSQTPGHLSLKVLLSVAMM